MKSISNVEYNM